MDELRQIIRQSKENPRLLHVLEQKLNILVASNDFSVLFALLGSNDPDCMFYACVVADKKLKLLIMNPQKCDSSSLICFIEQAVQKNCGYRLYNNKVSELASVAVMCMYPVHFSGFFELLKNAMCGSLGCILLKGICNNMNYCKYVDFERKSEAKRLLLPNIVQLITNLVNQFSLEYKNIFMDSNRGLRNYSSQNGINRSESDILMSLNKPSFINDLNVIGLLDIIMDCLVDTVSVCNTPMFREFVCAFGIFVPSSALNYFAELLSIKQDYNVAMEFINSMQFIEKQHTQELSAIIAETVIHFQLNQFLQCEQIMLFVSKNIVHPKFEKTIDFLERGLKAKGSQEKYAYIAMNTSFTCTHILIFLDAFLSAHDFFKETTISEFLKNPGLSTKGISNSTDSQFFSNLHEILQKIDSSFYLYISELEAHKIKALVLKTTNFLLSVIQTYPKLVEDIFGYFKAIFPKKATFKLLKACQNKVNISLYTAYQECCRLYFLKDQRCCDLILNLNLSCEEDVFLFNKIAKDYRINTEIYLKILDSPDVNNDLRIVSLAALKERKEDSLIQNHLHILAPILSGDFTVEKKNLLLALISQNNIEQIEEYFQYFLKLTPDEIDKLSSNSKESSNAEALDFKILRAIYKNANFLPQEIYHKIYISISSFSLPTIKNTINFLIVPFSEDIANFYIPIIINRIISIYEDYSQLEIVPCVKSLFNYIEKKIIKYKNLADINQGSFDTQNNSENELIVSKINIYTNFLQEMLMVQEKAITSSIYTFILRNQITLNNKDTLYKLLVLYNSPRMINGHNDILNFMIHILNNGGSQDVLYSIPNFDENRVRLLLTNLQGSIKRKREVLRAFLQDLEGKHITKQVEDRKIGKICVKKSNTQ